MKWQIKYISNNNMSKLIDINFKNNMLAFKRSKKLFNVNN